MCWLMITDSDNSNSWLVWKPVFVDGVDNRRVIGERLTLASREVELWGGSGNNMTSCSYESSVMDPFDIEENDTLEWI